jgi:hypothetical protein
MFLFFILTVWYSLSKSISGTLQPNPISERQAGPTPTDTIPDCTYFTTANSGDTCASIANTWGITLVQFISYNPSVKSDCSGLVIGDSYCVEENHGIPPVTSTTSTSTTTVTSGPTPTQSGITNDCKTIQPF